MYTDAEKPWIEAGYEIFAISGHDSIKVEQLAKKVGISKSSFYHHFKDIPAFIEHLLSWHLERIDKLALETKSCKTFDPDFLRVVLNHKITLMFNGQLRIHRNHIPFLLCFQHASNIVADAVLDVWATYLGLENDREVAKNIYSVMVELFFQRMTADNFNYEFMVGFLGDFKKFIGEIIKSSGIQLNQQNGN